MVNAPINAAQCLDYPGDELKLPAIPARIVVIGLNTVGALAPTRIEMDRDKDRAVSNFPVGDGGSPG
jgi:hypothetical protein